ncbi:hypothetical protein HNY73_011553 [Argiope bruennichi]|uniref:Uncharacterized protein n=1 Tax=Argiope bruennichi TaxID=94029 RepID=A0A8T0F1M8_ARGBR|nr:hypothetical protein HNY73_011553 [Argiope bruennichi]
METSRFLRPVLCPGHRVATHVLFHPTSIRHSKLRGRRNCRPADERRLRAIKNFETLVTFAAHTRPPHPPALLQPPLAVITCAR